MTTQHDSLYIVLISVHGLIRSSDLELGRDADTGGQTRYVVDLARALARRSDVRQVDLITRRLVDTHISEDYAREIEELADNARIVRIEAGPEEYIRKEELWDHLDTFADNTFTWLDQQPQMPDILHSHYADAGYVGVRLSNLTGIPLVHTGHSLGRDKRRRLLAMGLKRDEIEARYHMFRRVEAEEEVLANASLVITSTNNEIKDQYELYDFYQPERMAVIPPGTDLEQLYPPADDELQHNSFRAATGRFLQDADKPMILALSRPDPRKNITALVEAYGESERLQQLANLLIVAGNRDDIREMDDGPQGVMTDILLLIDYYDLYGRVALPKHHQADQVADIYRLAAISGGVFINPALTEPFGLTLLEAGACGLPLVATENGGPVDIIGNCHNGLLVDPLKKEAISKALLQLLEDREQWRECSENGLENVRKYYSWDAHADSYMEKIKPLLQQERPPYHAPMSRPAPRQDRAIFSDLDQNLLGESEGLQNFIRLIRENRRRSLFGIATGRRLDSASAILKEYDIPLPDVLLTSLGTEIYYAPKLTEHEGWARHIDHMWQRRAIRRVLADLPGLSLQPSSEQSRFKISYYYDAEQAPPIEEIKTLLRKEELTANVIHAFGQYLDIIPVRASKGLALRYLTHQWQIPLEHILVAGGSGADEDMMRGNTLAVVVANRHHEELSQLVEHEQIYFATQPHALGIIEAIEHYDFFRKDLSTSTQ